MNIKSFFMLAALLVALPLGSAQAQAAKGPKQLLADQFKSSKRVTFIKVEVNVGQRKQIEQQLGRALPKDRYTFYVAMSGDRVDGYAIFDAEKGQHENIDLAIFFDASGKVQRVEVVQYREAYGDAIRAERFRRQFVGKDGKSAYRAGDDIDVISGATISSKSVARAVKRAAVLLHQTVLKDEVAQQPAQRASL
ncbi:MAG: FMN-binding protein [Myxococcales bacterium]|nr:FMN-binding protein [Myxococcales bacterium]